LGFGASLSLNLSFGKTFIKNERKRDANFIFVYFGVAVLLATKLENYSRRCF